MKFKILDTTDDKYEGEVFEANSIISPGQRMTYKDTSFIVDKVIQKGNKLTLICANYQVIAELIEE